MELQRQQLIQERQQFHMEQLKAAEHRARQQATLFVTQQHPQHGSTGQGQHSQSQGQALANTTTITPTTSSISSNLPATSHLISQPSSLSQQSTINVNNAGPTQIATSTSTSSSSSSIAASTIQASPTVSSTMSGNVHKQSNIIATPSAPSSDSTSQQPSTFAL